MDAVASHHDLRADRCQRRAAAAVLQVDGDTRVVLLHARAALPEVQDIGARRSSTAASRVICRSPRWIDTCGQA